MKRISFLLTTLATLSLSAQEVQLVTTQVDNGGLVPGTTYRVYAQVPSADYSVHAVYGWDENPIVIQSTAPFYQHPYAGNTAREVIDAVFSSAPEMAYDSWVTIGAENSTGNELWDVNIDFDAFNNGTELVIPDGSWFLIPTGEQTKPDASGLVLLMQYTTTGNVNGTLNLQGWVGADNTVWKELSISFSTTQLDVIGCTDATAANYDPAATIDSGLCNVAETENPSTPSTPVATADKSEKEWTIFPNPVMHGQINIQFNDALTPAEGNSVVVSIFELSGKLVMRKDIGSEEIIGGNRIILSTDLAAGSYQVAVQQGEKAQAQTIIVQ
jgi:hypothetical protein